MVTEFTQHPAGIIEAGRADVANGVMNLKFTRLKKTNKQCLLFLMWLTLPLVLQRPKTDVAWLKQFPSDTKPLIGEDIMPIPANPKTLFVFSPLWDMPPSRPDTMQTTMAYLDRAMHSCGMECTILTFDLQLYIVGCLVKWSDQERWKRIILRPRMIHALQSFLACIGFLIKVSGLDVLIWAAFGGFTGILDGKS